MSTLSEMLPSAGLFLPGTLHRAVGSMPVQVEGEGTALKYFQRRNARPKQERRSSEDRPSIAIPRDLSLENTNAFTSLATTFYFADYVSSSDKASTETVLFAHLIQLVRQDISEASRLYSLSAVSNFLDTWPNKRTWVDTSLLEVRHALNDIGVDMDTAWGHDEDGSTVASKRKFEWGMRNQKKLLKRQQQLKTCQHDLTGAIHIMQTVELFGLPGGVGMMQDPIFEAPVRPWVPNDDRNALRGPYSRQKYRPSQTNLSASNVTLSSEVEKDDVDTHSVNSIPIELAGSTPADLVYTGNMDIHSMLRPRAFCDLPTEYSTLMRRPRAHSNYFRPVTPRDTRSRASLDVASSLSKFNKTKIERNDSTMSTTATVSVPMVARRCRASSIDITRQSDKHRSLPSELPHLQSQSSLIDDLMDYVLPGATSERLPSRECADSSTLSVPSISVTPIPTI
ncbi:hypothetical protein EJ02DRAFT_388009, partial [Clathrospora elynae]